MIVPEFWDDMRITERSVEARLLAAWLLTAREATLVPGLANVGVAGLAESVRLPYDATQSSLRELVLCSFAQHDEHARLIRVPKAPRYHSPNANCLRAWFRRWKAMPASHLREAHVASIKESLKSEAKWAAPVWAETFGSLCPSGTQLELGMVPVDKQVSLHSRHLDKSAVDNFGVDSRNRDSGDSNNLNHTGTIREPFANHSRMVGIGMGIGICIPEEGGSGGEPPIPPLSDEPPGWLNGAATGPRPRTNGRPQEFAYGSAQVVLGSVGRSNTCTRCGAQEGPRVYEGRDVLCNPCRFGGAA